MQQNANQGKIQLCDIWVYILIDFTNLLDTSLFRDSMYSPSKISPSCLHFDF